MGLDVARLSKQGLALVLDVNELPLQLGGPALFHVLLFVLMPRLDFVFQVSHLHVMQVFFLGLATPDTLVCRLLGIAYSLIRSLSDLDLASFELLLHTDCSLGLEGLPEVIELTFGIVLELQLEGPFLLFQIPELFLLLLGDVDLLFF